MEINQLMTAEAKLITSMFQRNGIKAKVNQQASYCVETGFLHYGLSLHPATRFAEVERLQRELSVALSNLRRRKGLPEVQALPVDSPSFALETPHPTPKLLLWSGRSLTSGPAHSMLLGRSYVGKPADEATTFDDSCHVLIAGITGSGKSVLMQHMLLSLTATTDPASLRLILVDLKNEDLLPFKALPHALTFAGTRDQALDAIRFVYTEKERRVATEGYKPYQLVLIIDEMAQLAAMRDVTDTLGDLASIGRSKMINLIGATQHPTEKGGLGSLLKANFPLRLVGMVAPGQSYAATGRAGLHADLLPGKGSFLRLQGPTVKRFQSFYIDADDVALMCRKITNEWNQRLRFSRSDKRHTNTVDTISPSDCEQVDIQPATASYTASYNQLQPATTTSTRDTASIASYETANNSCQAVFPIKKGRSLSEHEAQFLRQMTEAGEFDYRGQFSMNRAMEYVYGSRDPQRSAWIKQALEKVSV